MPAATQDGEHGIAGDALEWEACKATIHLHVADFRFDCAAPPELGLQRFGHPAAHSGDQDTRSGYAMAAVSAIDNRELGAAIGERLDLLQRLGQGVAVVWISRHGPHTDDKALIYRRRDADLAAEFVAHASLPLRDAVDIGLMQREDLATAIWRLVQQRRGNSPATCASLPACPMMGDDPMQDLQSLVGALRRPPLLVRAARCGTADYRRELRLPRLLGAPVPDRPGIALMRLMDLEAEIDADRRQRGAGYSAARHVEVLVAIICEARALDGCAG